MEFLLSLNCCANVFIIFLSELVWVLILSLWLVWHPLYLFTHPSDNGGDQYYINNFFLIVIYLFIYCMYVFLIIMFLLCIWTNVWNKELLLLLLLLLLIHGATLQIRKSVSYGNTLFICVKSSQKELNVLTKTKTNSVLYSTFVKKFHWLFSNKK